MKKKPETNSTERNNFYKTLFDNSSTAMCIIEKNNILSLVNNEFAKFVGFSKKEIEEKKPWTDFALKEDLIKIRTKYIQNLRKDPKSTSEYEFRAIDANKNARTILLSISLIPGTYKSIATLLDITERNIAEERNKNLNRVLHAIRDINIFLTKENDTNKLLQGVCDILTKTMGYSGAWILLYDNSMKFIKDYHTGRIVGYDDMIKDLKEGKINECTKRSLKEDNVVAIEDVCSECGNCPMLGKNPGLRELVLNFKINDNTCGVLAISVPTEFTNYKEEHSLIEALASDIETALQNIENKKNKKKADLELLESENYIKAIYNSIHAGVVLIDEETHKIVDINNSAAKIIGADPKYIIGNICHKFICPAEKGKCPISDLKQEIDNSEKTILTCDGIQIPIIKTVKSIILKGRKCFLESFVDITEIKYVENELRIAKEKAEESDSIKTAFFHTLSHELRTPLNAIIGFSNLLMYPLPDEEILEYSQSINDSGNQLLNIIQDMLDLTIMEGNKYKFRKNEFKLDELFKELPSVIEKIQNKIQKQHIEIKFIPSINDQNTTIYSNSSKIKQILIELLSNAIKFTKKGSVEYGFNIYKNEILFFIKDTGIGIPVEKHKVIFEKFRQADNSLTREFSGIGLGLALVKRIVELLGGEIWVESSLNIGSTFYFNIPNKPKTDILLRLPENIDFSDKTILITEDEESNFCVIKTMLVLTQANILRAKNGQEALDICAKDSQVDLVIMDLKMPVMDGFIATEKIKKLFPGLPIIVVTAYSSDNEKDDAFESGCDEFINKPINKKKLLTLLFKYLRK
ncbi:MAG: PAS domain S-box protein [Bacteroidales bacterium]|nr:PAS domain S-box protein [Bacteroidales bacterium]